VWGAYAVFAASAPPTPSLSASPSVSPTNSGTETFTFTSSGATSFLCSLNNAPFTACTSPKAYGSPTALADGSYNFRVEASDKNGHLSSPASYSWVVDKTSPPTPSITAKPTDPSTSTTASFSFTDSEAGASFQCKLDAATYAACTSPAAYSSLALGSHTFSVQAKDAAGNLSAAAAWTWQIVPPTPTITAKPSNPTNQTSASFSFSDTLAGVTYVCALDTATFTSCSSPQSYAGPLAQGSHSFQVKAVSGSNQSAAASYTWTIDTSAPPTPTIVTKPASLSNTTSPTFAFSDSEAGVSYLCKLDAGSYVACSNPTTYSGLSQGTHSFSVEAKDAAGNASTPTATYSWTIDSIPPPAPVLTYKPDDPNGDGIANFDWTESESGTTFQCSLENGSFSACTPGEGHMARYIVDVSNDGTHQFAVRAYDAAGNFSAASYSWKVLHAVNVVADGNAVGLLYPNGPALPIALVLHNPNNFPVTISYINVTVKTPWPPGCDGSSASVAIVQSNVGNGANPVTVTVPANSNFALPTANRPTIRLLDNGNQDACKTKSFTLSYLAKGSK
jgi:hypothetical protein